MKQRSREYIVGAFTLLAIGAVIYITINLSRIGLFTEKYDLTIYFRDASGLEIGAPVKVFGVRGGTVRQLRWDEIQHDGYTYFVAVDVEMRGDIKLFESAIARCVTAGLVGETEVSIKAGSDETKRLGDGDIIYGDKAPSITDELKRVPAMLDAAEEVLEGVRTIVGDTDNQRSIKVTLGNLEKLTDRSARIAEIAEEESELLANDLTALRKQVRGMADRLDDSLTSGSEDLAETLQIVRAQAETFEAKTEPLLEEMEAAARSTRLAADQVRVTMEKPSEDFQRGLEYFARISERIDKMLARIETGRGSLGRLLNDESLYETVTGTADSLTGLLGGGGDPVFPKVQRPFEDNWEAPTDLPSSETSEPAN